MFYDANDPQANGGFGRFYAFSIVSSGRITQGSGEITGDVSFIQPR
jgi:hypothetical protein